MKRLRTRRLRFLIYGTLAGLLIVAAAFMGLAGLAFPWVLDHPERVEAMLAERLQRDVEIGNLRGNWENNGPIFIIEDLRIGARDAGEPLRIPTAELKIDFYAPFKRGVSWQELRIIGLSIDVQRDLSGRWQLLQWRSEQEQRVRDFSELDRLGSVRILRSSLNIRDDLRGHSVRIQDIDLDVLPGGTSSVVRGRLTLNQAVAPLLFRCEGQQRWNRIDCYIEAKKFDAAVWTEGLKLGGIRIRKGEGNLAVWLNLRAQRVTHSRIEWQLKNLELAGVRPVQLPPDLSIEPRVSLPSSAGSVEYRYRDGLDELALLEGDDLEQPEGLTRLNLQRLGERWQLAADQIQVGRFARLATLLESVSPKLAGWLFEASPQGVLTGVSLHADHGALQSISARATALGMSATRQSPAFEALAGTVHGDGGAVFFELDPNTASAIDYPHVFGRRVPVNIQELRVALIRDTDFYRIEAWPLRLDGEGFSLAGHAAIDLVSGETPLLDLGVEVFPSDILAAKDFWPLNTMPAKTVQWLNDGLKRGRIDHGYAVFRGHPSDWPFFNDEGRFEAVAHVADVDLHYAENWPDGLLKQATARFINKSMSVDLIEADVLGNRVYGGYSTIANMKDPVLTLDTKAVGDGENLLALMRQSPLALKYGEQMAGLRVGGVGEVEVSMRIPLRKDLGEHEVDGRVRLRQADLADDKWQLRFGQAYGTIRFSESGFSADALHVLVGEDLGQLSIAVGNFVSDPERLVAEANLQGNFPAASAMSGFPALQRFWPLVPGKTDWNLSLSVDRAEAGQLGRKRLSIQSDLKGIALALPAPLRKDAETAMPLTLAMDLPAAGSNLSVQLGHLLYMTAHLQSPTQPFGGAIQLGSALPPVLPEQGLEVSGNVPAVDLGSWASLVSALTARDAASDAPAAEPMPINVDVQAAELNLLGRAMPDTRLRVTRQDDSLRLDFSGPAIEGNFLLPNTERARRGVTARFDRLHWPEAMATPVAASAPAAPTLDPKTLPPLHIWIQDLRLGDSQFGEARIEARPDELGLQIDQFDTRSPQLTIRGGGWWRLTAEGERSGLDITFSSEDLGKMLATLGYAGLVDGGQTVARLNGDWVGSPAQFKLDRMDGALTGEVGPGRILDVDPGAGRLFGLVNFGAIPRRLTLDFRDFFEKGMAFDSIKAGFQLKDGDAYTDDLNIQSPSAEIRVRGRAGLAAHDYDQIMEVRPRVGGTLPVVGAVAAGPVGALAGVLAQGVLKKPLDAMASATYQVQGTWDDPKITLLSKSKSPGKSVPTPKSEPAAVPDPNPTSPEQRS